jgi:hypothetical protein
MSTTMLNRQNAIIAVLILLAVISRLLPHPPNFAPIAAIALFGGAMFSSRALAFMMPFVAMVVSDAIIGFHSHMPVVYGLFLVTVLIGFVLRDRVKMGTVIGASLLSSTLFFLGSNLAVWYGSAFYSQDWSGLMMCYTMAIPFFQNTLLGDLFYSGALFGSFFWISQRYPTASIAN